MRGKPFDSTHWICFKGCPANTNGGDLNYVLTAIGDNPGWEQGEKSFLYQYTGTKQLSFSLSNVNWSLTSYESTPLPAYMETVIDVRIRNDTNVSNASPMAGLPPYIGIPHGCFWNVKLPVMDPDEDMLKCRFALPTECGHACTNLPDAYIEQSSCTIVLNVTSDRGYNEGDSYRVAVVIEDYPLYSIQLDTTLRTPSQSLSSIPLQFTIRVLNSTSCQNKTSFVLPTREDGFRSHVLRLNQKFLSAFYIETPDTNNTEFLVSSPAGMKYEKLLDDNNRANVTRVYQTWRVDKSNIGDTLICVWVKEPSGLMSDKMCIDAMILDNDDCVGSPCTRGQCVDLFHRRICKCPPGYKPPDCDDNVTCADNPCLNNGTCFNTLPYTCRCPPDYTGNRCEYEINPCMSMPCLNGGKCRQILVGFECLCRNGFIGSRCQTGVTDPCHSGPCNSSAKCVSHQNGFSCLCPPGLTGKLCNVNINECNHVVCYNGGSCIDNFGSYSCVCSSGWHGQVCKDDIDECNLTQICNHGSCMNTPGSYTCLCDTGWTGAKCDVNIDDCASSSCINGGTCIDRVGSYICQCPYHWKGVNCETPSHINQCLNKPCQNGATCLETGNYYKCVCTRGWMGAVCDIDFNECKLTGICNNGACSNLPGSYKCTCNTGWTGHDCNIKIDYCFPSPCLNGATCLDLIGKYTCQCPVGWTGINCSIPSPIDYCSKSPCKNDGTCINTGTNFSCLCKGGWIGQDCSMDIDECNIKGVCNHGTCHNTPGNYKCSCNRGWTNKTCNIDINECHSAPCLNGATCFNVPGDYFCKCALGLVGKHCENLSNINLCSKMSPCKNGATCVGVGTSFKCVCDNGWSGHDCGIDIDECNTAGICGKRSCSNTLGSYKCHCSGGWTGQANTGDCKPNTKQSGLDINLSNSTPQLPWIILASILGGLLLLTTVIGCYICLCGTSSRTRSVKGHEDNDRWADRIKGGEKHSDSNSKNKSPNSISQNSFGENWNNSSSRWPISKPHGRLFDSVPQSESEMNNIYLASRNDPFMHKSGRV